MSEAQRANQAQSAARVVAFEALRRIDEGAYANLVLPSLLEHSALDRRDRDFVTELTYGVTRMRRACDWIVDQHARGRLEPAVRDVLRLGVYQLLWLRVPSHAAVSETVSLSPPRARGLVNAVLRSVTRAGDVAWPSKAVELSYPDWIVRRLEEDLGAADAGSALETMNKSPEVSVRTDGYTQDRASQWVADAVEARAGSRVADTCAAPGGKATGVASQEPELVVASDVNPARCSLVARNAVRLGASRVAVVCADGRRPALRTRRFDRVLVDAPCSGLGVLRRRPDARWRIEESDVDDLASLQRQLLDAAVDLLGHGGRLVYSVCTLTSAETAEVDGWLATAHPELRPLARPEGPWRPWGRGGLLLPQDAGTDGMYILRLEAPGG